MEVRAKRGFGRTHMTACPVPDPGLQCGSWDTSVISRRLKNQTMLDKKCERAEAEESDSA